MPRRTSVADAQPLRFVLVTMDRHLAGAAERARQQVCRELPNLEFTQHAVCDWNENPAALARCVEDIGKADLIVAPNGQTALIDTGGGGGAAVRRADRGVARRRGVSAFVECE